jgi:hypothetical protein
VTGEPTATEVALGAQALPLTLDAIEDAIVRASGGEAIDLTTEHEVVVKYVVPTAAVRGVRAGYRRDGEGAWRITLRPRSAPKSE